MKEFFLTGTPGEVVDQAAEWRDNGLRYLVVMNLSILQPSLRNGLAANAILLQDSSRAQEAMKRRGVCEGLEIHVVRIVAAAVPGAPYS